MSIALGLPFRDLFALVLGKSDLKSMFCLIVFSIVVLILAYLTNPTENSFRSYLTEQSFRHHLSKLDDNADDNNLRIDHIRSLTSPKNKPATPVSSSVFALENWPSFHFANRASISLRTPKHVFHSFGVFTIAAMLPTTKTSERGSRDVCMISDSWYVGVFGRWWRGGFFEEWYQDVITGPKDEESWTSGILNMKRLDMLQDYKVPTFSANNLPAHLSPGTPPRLRNRDRSTQRNDAIRRRSTTPPPLPKSASLPMHTVRSGSRVYDSARLRQQQSPENTTRVSAPPSRSPSTSLEQSPAIAEVLHQIAGAKTSVAELRAQLTECQTSASQSRSVLQKEVDAHRGKKREEDASKAELKTRTKNLEDSKRNAEGLKKEADKRLKVAQTTRDDATRRIEFLDTGISQLQEQVAQDLEFISSRENQAAEEERITPSSIERKRQEIKVAEDQVHTLNQRSKDLEERLSSRGEKLRILREKIEQYNERHSAANCDQQQRQQQRYHTRDLWLVGTDDVRQPLTLSPLSPVQHNERVWNMQLDSFGSQNPSSCTPSGAPVEEHVTALNGKGFSPFSDPSLFDGYANDIRHTSRTSQGYFAQEIAPIGLGTAFEDDNKLSRSFKSDSDPYLDTNYWPVPYANGKLDGSPLTTSSASTDDVHISPYYSTGLHFPPAQRKDKTRFRGSSLSSKGLNPDAKEFNFAPLSNSLNTNGVVHNSSVACRTSPTTYDALNPSGIPSTTTTTQQSLLRAFALSPAEREALQRTLGVLNNKSFERLPSLSDVGSIPSSPTSNGHGLPSLVTSSASDFGSRLPGWLQSLPRNRKVNFSPWDDEEPQNNPRKN